ncbi:MAG TPA: DUF3768 domain-containing protein [Fimbriimonadaceae bacterium]|nr:DUF3768 domain-containing protein [Fimbriimonadaceae bacterium]
MDTRIRQLNDALRITFLGGRIVVTAGVAALPDRTKAALFAKVHGFIDFNEDNDPHGEHDFGSVEQDGVKFFWKIDYYDRSLEYGSEDPADPDVTTRVLTIMRADEY